MIDLTEKDGTITFKVCVVPRSSRSEIVGEHYRALKVKLAAPPVDGAANAELIKLLAKHFRVAKADVEIVGGGTSKNKRIKIGNLSKSEFEHLIP